ncbi:MAG: hypothetical protein ACR2JB_23895 [Bryobacteraceae bacterium]
MSVATRTLLAAGYEITNCQRHPGFAEISCQSMSRLGALLHYLIAVTDQDDFTIEQRQEITREAEADRRAVSFIALSTAEGQISWDEFLDALGGAVPSWRALSQDYADFLRTTAHNELPDGCTGEAWHLFEGLVADGLEFAFGRRVRRLGGNKRGPTVSDMLAQLPDTGLEIVDTKASKVGFQADWPALRPLAEYVGRQRQRQRGHNEVAGALVVSSNFKQDGGALSELSRRFLAETGVPVAFLAAASLSEIVTELQRQPDLRSAIRWRPLLAGGLLQITEFRRELDQARSERCTRVEG